ncbi:hypothetical protein ABEB36_008830, partial [Hypothenemus hampei]
MSSLPVDGVTPYSTGLQLTYTAGAFTVFFAFFVGCLETYETPNVCDDNASDASGGLIARRDALKL